MRYIRVFHQFKFFPGQHRSIITRPWWPLSTASRSEHDRSHPRARAVSCDMNIGVVQGSGRQMSSVKLSINRSVSECRSKVVDRWLDGGCLHAGSMLRLIILQHIIIQWTVIGLTYQPAISTQGTSPGCTDRHSTELSTGRMDAWVEWPVDNSGTVSPSTSCHDWAICNLTKKHVLTDLHFI